MSAQPAERPALQLLRALLLDEGGPMASLVEPAEDRRRVGNPGWAGPPSIAGFPPNESPARLAASGPRAEGHREDYELLIEVIYEGYLLHYGTPRVARTAEADLGLLAGDRLYALGLARLVALGDTEAVTELADTITLSALAQSAGETELADAVWTAGARAIGWGSSESHRRAKDLALTGAAEAIEAMRTSAAGLSAPP
jgi:hypothetical protein